MVLAMKLKDGLRRGGALIAGGIVLAVTSRRALANRPLQPVTPPEPRQPRTLRPRLSGASNQSHSNQSHSGEGAEVDLAGLLIGTASAALQIEGECAPNDWSRWAQIPGAIADGSTPEPATHHWSRWREDNALMEQLGFPIARIGLEWARIEPEPGCFDQAVIARYRDEIADLQARGIEPLVTLHHFVNPLWFTDRGGFCTADSVGSFSRYVRKVVAELGDIVSEWITINEPNVYATQAHLFREAPPGNASWRDAMLTLRHMALAHIAAYRIIHTETPGAEAGGASRAQRRIQVGFAHHARSFTPLRPRNPIHRLMTTIDRTLFRDIIADAALTGHFHPLLGGPRISRKVGRGRYYDFLGLNYYSRTAVRGISDGTLPDVPVNDLDWEIYPRGLAEQAEWLHRRFGAPVWVTENGTCDNWAAGGVVGNKEDAGSESFRSRFILEHLQAIAGSEAPIERYYHWCFVDNWEWSEGYWPRFGVVGMVEGTGERVVKPSGRLLAELAATGRITREMWRTYAAGQSYPVFPGEGGVS